MKDYKGIELINMNSLISEENIWAHTDSEKDPETIFEHSDRILHFLYKLMEKKGLDKVLNNIISEFKIEGKNIDDDVSNFIKELFINAVYLHDFGKINPSYQKNVLKNDNIFLSSEYETADSNHSWLSALIYIDIFMEKIKKIDDKLTKKFLKNIIFDFSYVISKHHSSLGDLEEDEYIKNLKQWHDRISEDNFHLKYYLKYDRIKNMNIGLLKNNRRYINKENTFQIYILIKLLFSCIVSCDSYATYFYHSGTEPDFGCISGIENIIKRFESSDVNKGIEEYKKNKNYFEKDPINALRSELFIESEKNLIENMDKANIFYLEAPTGSGKTNTSINLALNIVKKNPEFNKIFYIFPFNTLVEQTSDTFNKIFNEKDDIKAAVINSITPIITNEDENNYDEDLINRQMLHYPVVLTTHVNFFNYLFGTGREINLALAQLCNSIVILDEIQSYRNEIWPEIIKFLSMYSKLFNIKIIIMSATLPKLDELIELDDINICELIEDKSKYYNNPLFKNRVSLDFSMLKKEKNSKEEIIEMVEKVINERKESKILIEFITKTAAREFYSILKGKFPEKKVREITGDDNILNRKNTLKEIRGSKDIIVVATQVIEAGIDIDMEVGFKDISMLDSEEQFLGRINRSCLNPNCICYFFDYNDASKVYKKDFRLEKSIKDKAYQDILKSKDFDEFYRLCFKRLKEKKREMNENNIELFNENILMLNFSEIMNYMKLISLEQYQLFINHEVILEDKTVLSGTTVWDDYKKLIHDNKMQYSKKRIELSKLYEKMSYFIYNYYDFDNKYDKRPKFYLENIGNIFYIENGEEFIDEDGKFDRKKYNEKQGGSFL